MSIRSIINCQHIQLFIRWTMNTKLGSEWTQSSTDCRVHHKKAERSITHICILYLGLWRCSSGIHTKALSQTIRIVQLNNWYMAYYKYSQFVSNDQINVRLSSTLLWSLLFGCFWIELKIHFTYRNPATQRITRPARLINDRLFSGLFVVELHWPHSQLNRTINNNNVILICNTAPPPMTALGHNDEISPEKFQSPRVRSSFYFFFLFHSISLGELSVFER